MPILEFVSVGGHVKISAIDENTGREVVVIADPKTPKSDMERLAINKLKYVLEKESGNKKPTDSDGGIIA